jgi:hypothetical protein
MIKNIIGYDKNIIGYDKKRALYIPVRYDEREHGELSVSPLLSSKDG